MKAVIMAGGEGTRLRPLTSRQPKPLLPVVNRPMMEHVVDLLKRHGIDDIIVTIAFQADAIRNYFGDGSEFGVRFTYATEDVPLGTAGSVLNARLELTEPFLVISGDVLTDIDISALVGAHKRGGAAVTIALESVENPLDFGIVIQNPDGSIARFLEKPTWGQVFSDTVNTGIYVLDPSVFEHIPADGPSDFSGDVFPKLLEAGVPISGHVVDGYWEDVGTHDAYLRAHFDALDARVEVDVPGFLLANGVWLGEGAEVSPEASIDGPAVIGPYTTVDADAHIGEYTVLGSNVRVGRGADIRRSVVHDNAYIGASTRMQGTVVCRSADLRHGVSAEEGVVIGDETFVGDHAMLSAGVKIYPNKEIEHGAVVNTSVVWETRARRHLFGTLGIRGLANVDITPELAVRVAMSFGSSLKKGTVVSLSRDSSRSARTVARATAAGLNASGVNVLDLEVAPLPVNRFLVRSQRSRAGMSVRIAPDDSEAVIIRFLDDNGHDVDELTQRKIERTFHREDFRRVAASEIGDIGFTARAVEYYTAALIEGISIETVRQASFKVVLDYAYGSTSFVMPNVLSKLNAEVLAVNPYGSTRAMLHFDRQEHAARVASLVQTSGAHLGAVFDADGERITLIDDTGHILSDEESRLVIIALVGSSLASTRVENGGEVVPRRIVLPVSAPNAASTVAGRYGLEVEWTKLSPTELMARSSDDGVILGADAEGGFIFPEILPAHDATATMIRLLEMLARSGDTMSHVLDSVPRAHLSHDTVATPWEHKGSVMRNLVESVRGHEVVSVDGVKVIDGDTWVLVYPDPERALTHVWAEGASIRDARSLAQQYARQIRLSSRS